MACCVKAFLRVLGIEEERETRRPHINAIGLYDMSRIDTNEDDNLTINIHNNRTKRSSSRDSN